MADAALDVEAIETDPRLDALQEPQELFDPTFSEAEEEQEEVTGDKDEEAAQFMPGFGTDDWHDYVMRQFKDNELIGGAPTCDGCRRILEQLVGPVISTSIPSYIGPEVSNNGTATVVISIEVLITNESHPANGRVIKVEEIADVNNFNTDAPYNKYPSATAATRAEGRAYRKLLRLRNVFTAEEVSKVAEESDGNDWEPDEPITSSQIAAIDMLCGTNRLNMDVMQFVSSGRKTYGNVLEVKKSTAQRMIQELNKIQREAKPKPPGIGTYIPNWQNVTR